MATFLTVNNIKTLIINYKDNVGGASNEQIIEYCEFMNRFLYPKFVAVNPNDYLSNSIIKTVSNTASYTLPSDFRDLRTGAVFETRTSSDFGAISYDAKTDAFSTIGQTITGGTSGATGTLSSVVDYGTTGTLVMTSVSGTFQDNETLTGTTEGSATSNGTVTSFKYSNNNRLVETEWGGSAIGFFLDSSNINFTPTPSQSKVLTLRYLPELDTLDALSDSTIIPVQYKEYARNAADVYWNQWRDKSNGEFEASQRTQLALEDMLLTIRKTSNIMNLPNRSNIYRRKRNTTRFTSTSV